MRLGEIARLELNYCVPLPIPKIKNSTDFGHLILVVPYFQFFFVFYIFYFFRRGCSEETVSCIASSWESESGSCSGGIPCEAAAGL